MSRNEIEIEWERYGLWKPYYVYFTLPAGLTIRGNGWTLGRAFRHAMTTTKEVLEEWED